VGAPTNLPRFDVPPIEYQQGLSQEMGFWFADLPTLFNQAMTQIGNVFANVLTFSSADIGGSGAGPINVSVPGLTTSGAVFVNLLSSSNPVSIAIVTVGTNQFSVTFSADPGASAIIQYSAFTAAP
jgi:hypothetical protein